MSEGLQLCFVTKCNRDRSDQMCDTNWAEMVISWKSFISSHDWFLEQYLVTDLQFFLLWKCNIERGNRMWDTTISGLKKYIPK